MPSRPDPPAFASVRQRSPAFASVRQRGKLYFSRFWAWHAGCVSRSRPMQATLRLVSLPTIELRYRVHAALDEWVVPEGTVPESIPHSSSTQHILALLSFWASSAGRPLFVARNLAVRWLEARPAVGIDPDVCLLDPPPPEVESLSCLCLWKAGHLAPPLAFEVV